MLQQFQAAMQIIQQAAMVDPMIGQMAMQAGLMAPEQMQAMAQQQAQAQPQQGTPEERAARATTGGDNSQATKARVRAANAALPR